MESPQLNLCISSLVFFTNAIVTYYYEYYLYSLLFVALAVSSSIHHWCKTQTSYIIDKLFVFAIVGYGAYVFFNKLANNTHTHNTCIIY